jgi:hypothetical protein
MQATIDRIHLMPNRSSLLVEGAALGGGFLLFPA